MAAAATDPKKAPAAPRDPAREAVETVVFVVVLVLLLKLFVTEAFVIPTGSMAETLYGYQKMITCPKCGHEFPVNCHDEVEPNQATGRKHLLVGYTCPNCRFPGRFPPAPGGGVVSPPYRSGDRVLVLKPVYHLAAADRGDVVVFKYPEEPQQKQTAQNYIKRAQGFGGETVGIHRGDLYVTRALQYPPAARDEDGNLLYPRPDDPNDLWKGDPARGPDYRYVNNKQAADLFEKSRQAGFAPGADGFEIVRKPVDQLLADMRIVWDNDRQPTELAGKTPPRWYPDPSAGNWTGDQAQQPRTFLHKGPGLDWVRYRHVVYPWAQPGAEPKPSHVDNFLGYNAGVDRDLFTGLESSRPNSADSYWVGDLVLECEAEIGDGAAVVLELSKGQNRFQARFADGRVTLLSTGPGGKEYGSRPCGVTGRGKYRLRFANVDCRLHVWVDGKHVDFGTDADYPPGMTVAPGKEDTEGYTEDNDVAAPASVGAQGEVTVRGIKLLRDIYYTKNGNDHARADLYYVHPGHYLCLGDNSAQSSDGRKWGLVPDRLMLGKAVFVFAPFWGDGWLSLRFDRVGFIK